MLEQFYAGLAEIFEIDQSKINPNLSLEEIIWDSLAIVSTIALADECFEVILDGQSLSSCAKVNDIQILIEKAKES